MQKIGVMIMWTLVVFIFAFYNSKGDVQDITGSVIAGPTIILPESEPIEDKPIDPPKKVQKPHITYPTDDNQEKTSFRGSEVSGGSRGRSASSGGGSGGSSGGSSGSEDIQIKIDPFGVYRIVTTSYDNATDQFFYSVTLNVLLDSSTYYAIDEYIPDNSDIIDPGTAATDHAGHLKWVKIENVTDTEYSYELASGISTLNFNGIYEIESMSTPGEILSG